MFHRRGAPDRRRGEELGRKVRHGAHQDGAGRRGLHRRRGQGRGRERALRAAFRNRIVLVYYKLIL